MQYSEAASPFRSRKIIGAVGMSVVFLLTLTASFFGTVPGDVLSTLAIGVATTWTAQAGTQGIADARAAPHLAAKPTIAAPAATPSPTHNHVR